MPQIYSIPITCLNTFMYLTLILITLYYIVNITLAYFLILKFIISDILIINFCVFIKEFKFLIEYYKYKTELNLILRKTLKSPDSDLLFKFQEAI